MRCVRNPFEPFQCRRYGNSCNDLLCIINITHYSRITRHVVTFCIKYHNRAVPRPRWRQLSSPFLFRLSVCLSVCLLSLSLSVCMFTRDRSRGDLKRGEVRARGIRQFSIAVPRDRGRSRAGSIIEMPKRNDPMAVS